MKEEIITNIKGSKFEGNSKFIHVVLEVEHKEKKWNWNKLKLETITHKREVVGVVKDYGHGLGCGCLKDPITGADVLINGMEVLTQIEFILQMQGLLK